MTDLLHHGCCLEVMRRLDADSVDLIATDPPFATGRDWGAFDDRWDSLETYVEFLRLRAVEMRRVLKPTGSLYLHCDMTASHYVKVMLDGVFGRANFRNEIVWHYGGNSWARRHFPRKHDVILFYGCGDKTTFHILHDGRITERQREDLAVGYHKCHFWGVPGVRIHDWENPTVKANLDAWKAEGRIIRFVDNAKGKVIDSVWRLDYLSRKNSKIPSERVGYPTQKPVALYERIVQASSNAGDIVLDPFCGSGTTLVAAKRLGRQYIGIDRNLDALELAQRRLDAPLAPPPPQEELL